MALAPEGRRDYTCVQWDQVDDILSLVAELREVERLKSTKSEELQHSCHQTEGEDLKDKGEMETDACWGQQENHLLCLHR